MSDGPRIRIVSDGTPSETHVFINGEEAKDVTAIEWWIDVNSVGRARLDVAYVEVDVVGEQTAYGEGEEQI